MKRKRGLKAMKVILKEQITYLIDNDQEALDMIETVRNNQDVEGYILNKYNNTFKTKKRKGEDPIEYYQLVIEKKFPVEEQFFG